MTPGDRPSGHVVWDQHGCLPLRPDADLDDLEQYRAAGVDAVSINVGFDAVPWTQSLRVAASFRHRVLADDRFVLAGTTADVRRARAEGRLAVSFDLEGTVALDGDLAMVEAFHTLGVRTMLMAYNRANLAGGGCHDEDTGLTPFGRDVVAEMNRVGMVVDASHCAPRTTFELFECSTAPVVFSHSNPKAVYDHPRNITDEQLRGCAATGGVVGINGIGIFLGDNVADTATFVRHLEHAAEVAGPDHVGLGLDYVFDKAELAAFLREKAALFPAGTAGYDATVEQRFVEPGRIPVIAAALRDRGWPEAAVAGVLGGNFLRVADAVWPSPTAVASPHPGLPRLSPGAGAAAP